LFLEISGRALAGIGRFAGSDAKSHRPDDSIQNDLAILCVCNGLAVSYQQ
jgi:hypothetical protein